MADLQNFELFDNPQWPDTPVAAMQRATNYKVAVIRKENNRTETANLGTAYKIGVKNNSDGNTETGGGNKKSNNNNNNNNSQRYGAHEKGSSDNCENESSNSKKPAGGNKGGCYICGDPEHRQKDCPILKQAKAMAAENEGGGQKKGQAHVVQDAKKSHRDNDDGWDTAFMVKGEDSDTAEENAVEATYHSVKTQAISNTDVLNDNESSVSIFCNPALLTNIREAPKPLIITGVESGGELRVTQQGDFDFFGKVWYSPKASANILCFYDLQKRFPTSYDQETNSFSYDTPAGIKVFKAKGKHYAYDAAQNSNSVLVSTVAENEAKYTKREVEAAKTARDLIGRLGVPSIKELADMISRGSIANCPVTRADLSRALDIYGPDLAAL
jgi:hypothetical protein